SPVGENEDLSLNILIIIKSLIPYFFNRHTPKGAPGDSFKNRYLRFFQTIAKAKHLIFCDFGPRDYEAAPTEQ
ncbi:MAG TPA: hypothetical protein VF385_03430, partial [Patescibacteria group bacterium]